MSQKIVKQRKCAYCGKLFFPSLKNRKYCSKPCKTKGYKKPKSEHFKIKNPIALIQGIEIRYTRHIEHDEPMYLEGIHSKRNPSFKPITDELLWFNQGLKVGNLDLDIVKERGCKVSDVLLHNGYELEDPNAFDKAFKQSMKKIA